MGYNRTNKSRGASSVRAEACACVPVTIDSLAVPGLVVTLAALLFAGCGKTYEITTVYAPASAAGDGLRVDHAASNCWDWMRGCDISGPEQSDGPSDGALSSNSALPSELDEGDPVLLGLRELLSDIEDIHYDDLISSDLIAETTDQTATELSGQLRRGIVGSVQNDTQKLKNGVVRVQRYRLNSDLPPSRLFRLGGHTILPFKVRGGSEIEFARVFPSEGEANMASPLSLMDIPHDVESALKLPPQTVVTIPISGSVSINVAGAFISRTASMAGDLTSFLSTSVLGSLSATKQGTLLGRGDFVLQVIRLPGESVRVRIVSGATMEVSGSLNVGSVAGTTYRFLPSAPIDRVRSVRRRLETAKTTVEDIKSIDDRILNFRKALPANLDLLMDTVPGSHENENVTWVREMAEGQVDGALELVDDSSLTLDTLDALVLSRVEAVLETTTSLYDQKLAPMVNSVMRYSSHIFNLASSVKLSGDFSRQIRTVADYEFNLSNAAAREALNRAISGRAVILGAAQAIGPGGFGDGSFADLTLADAVAKEDMGSADPRVKRLALVSGDQREKHHAVTLYGLWMSTGMEWTNKQNTVRTTNSDGFTTTWLARAWEKKHKSSWIGGSQSETFGSGGYTEAQSAELLDGSYWFTWRRQFPNFTAKPVAEALAETLNLLGPIAIQVGVPAMYDGEYDGQVSAELSVLFPQSVMEAIFDPALTPDELLWEVLGDTAETFDNKHGLPYLVSPLTPEGATNTPGGAEACGKVASAFGGYYCWYFQDTFLPALRAAQDSDDPEDRLAFFEMFYKSGWFANPVGSRLLVRYISGLAYALDVSDATSVRIALSNAQDDSMSASPELEAGDPMDMALLEAVDPSLFVDL